MGKEEARWKAVMAETNFKKKGMAYRWVTWREVAGRTPPNPLWDGATGELIVLCEP